MELPTRDEINVYGSLDEEEARLKHFLGKTPEQAEAIFRKNSLYYFEDLLWMGSRAFCFYIPAAIRYLKSSDATGDSDALNALEGVLAFRLPDEHGEFATSLADLRVGVRYILDNWERFDIDPTIYRDLRERYVGWWRRLDAESGAGDVTMNVKPPSR